jgi:hypothetical protein
MTSAPDQNPADDVIGWYKGVGEHSPMTIVGFAESVRKEMSRGSGTELTPPSFTFILSGDDVRRDGDCFRVLT